MAHPKYNPIPQLTEIELQRFLSRIDKTHPKGCWIWTGARSTLGYGNTVVTRNKVTKYFRTTRIMWMLAKGSDPGDLFVAHRCDNPPCLNPDHLFLATQKENMEDCIQKGRWKNPGFENMRRIRMRLYVEQPERTPRGENHVHSVLTEQQALAVIEELKNIHRVKDIAGKFHVSRDVISSIKHKRTWKHLPR